jgi:hypothetical protein
VTGTLPVTQGGTGLGTLPVHGVLLGEATSNVGNVAAMAADTLLQGQGTGADPAGVSLLNCGSATQALAYSTSTHSFSCQTITVPAAANPSGLIGLTAANGSAATFDRSDATHAIDQSIAPTWTGIHTFSSTPTSQVVVSGSAGNFGAIQFIANAASAGFVGASGASNQLANGSTAGDVVIRTQSTNLDISTNAGTSVNAMKITSGGSISMPNLTVTSTAQTGTVCSGTSGLLTVDSTTTCLASSRRWKKDIAPLTVALPEVMLLKPVSYELKNEFNPHKLGRQIGLIAEDVADVDDRLVGRAPAGSVTGVRYLQLTALLTKAMQEQQHEINSLKRRLRKLEHAPQ